MEMPTRWETPQDRLIAKELERLSALSHAELAALDESATVTLDDGMSSARAIVWRDILEDGRVRIVVQTLALAGSCCVADLRSGGFIMAPDGTRSPIPEEMMYEFSMD